MTPILWQPRTEVAAATQIMALVLVAVPGAENEPAWSDGEVPVEHAIRGFHSVGLLLEDAAPTGAILTATTSAPSTSASPAASVDVLARCLDWVK